MPQREMRIEMEVYWSHSLIEREAKEQSSSDNGVPSDVYGALVLLVLVLSTLEGEVNSLMQQVADDYGLEVSVGLPQPAAHAIPTKQPEKVDEDDLSRRLAELKARG
ncbi:hypothetical protein Q3G72_018777 [Acer saccharum]|nr:hypothetical protein Q3G72_018777 [Acer saccharum]